MRLSTGIGAPARADVPFSRVADTVRDYERAGLDVVWVAESYSRPVYLYRSDSNPAVYVSDAIRPNPSYVIVPRSAPPELFVRYRTLPRRSVRYQCSVPVPPPWMRAITSSTPVPYTRRQSVPFDPSRSI